MASKKYSRCFVIPALLSIMLANHAYAQPIMNIQPRIRVIIDNDFGGDPDGVFALVQLLLSPSVEIRAIIGSHLKAGDGFDNSATQADHAVQKVNTILSMIPTSKTIPVLVGSNTAMRNDDTPLKNQAVDFIIKEATRTDTKLPLYVLCGGGLTEIASALLTNPAISNRLILVWIGGPEYAGLATPPPGSSGPEYNTNIDIPAARVVFNKSKVEIWQVPRNAYRQALLPYSELLTKVKPEGPVGAFLAKEIETLMTRLNEYKLNIGETYILGDSPLVLLTALQSSFEPDPSSSEYVLKQAPTVNEQGGFVKNESGRNIRVFNRLDIQTMFNDLFSKLKLLAQYQ